ncbi:MAG: flagellar hook-associated protein FlgK [Shewanella sp.]|nr:flagellar hook-associated protein FlgK [Shewanella sp.]MCF1429773.1 flagellar hook-associated protein FlgK [Shewanella sp.]MCF1438378.1 flagellar hook-associated protein FlgK [Shewanella sp.]MCF1457034.1 flagellar hook-associated protein FlgK [Shewanella sp.]
MSVDLLNIARTGILASQSQIGVTGNNITNVNTEGYHRQVAQQSTLLPQNFGGNFYGTGSYVSDVKRIYNDFATRELRLGQSALSHAETSHSKLTELDALLSQIGKTVPQGLIDLFRELGNLVDQPDDLGIRGGVLNSAGQLASAINQIQTGLDGQMKYTNDQIDGVTKRVNDIANELAHLNGELIKSGEDNMQLLDEQDSLLKELSGYVQINVIPQDGGVKSVMLGGSTMLVSGQEMMAISMLPGDPFPQEPRLSVEVGGKIVAFDGSRVGGELGALFQYREQTLKPAVNEIGQLALGIADAFNELQKQGLDLNGEVGSNIFNDINDPLASFGRVGAISSNTGTAALSAQITDTGKLKGTEYELTFIAPTTYELKDIQTGSVKDLTLSGTTLTGADGFTLNIDSGALADGDKFVIRPTAGAAAGLEVVMADPKGIAAAVPGMTADAGNAGDVSLKVTSIDNRNAINFPITGSELTFEIDTATNQFEVFDADGNSLGPAAVYTPPGISAYGFTFEVTANGTSTERFTFDLSIKPGDNTNALQMAKLNEAKLMNNGESSFADLYETTKQNVGHKAKSAEITMEAAETVYVQAMTRVQSFSGVNLDEEAANLMRFQQSYQAATRIMTVSQQIFDSLLTSVR